MNDRLRLIRMRNLLCIVTILLTPVFISGIYRGTVVHELSTVREYEWRVVRVFPHDTTAFTQGLIFRDGYLYESTGRRGKSEIRKVRLETGDVVQRQPLEDEYFGEGLTAWDDQLIQLTLSSNVGFVYDIQTFERNRTFQVDGEAWGLTSNGEELIMSDGSSTLHFLDPETFREIRQITVVETENRYQS